MVLDGMTREQAVIWAAGFLDGEGTIRLERRPKYGSVLLIVQAPQVDPFPLLRLKELWGGNISLNRRREERHADCYIWQIRARIALQCCREILPYLAVKSAHARLAIEFYALPGRGQGKRLRSQGRTENAAYHKMFKDLNRTGQSKPLERDRTPKKETPQLRLLSEVG